MFTKGVTKLHGTKADFGKMHFEECSDVRGIFYLSSFSTLI